jgi:two-component sensor histidine kinase
MLFAHAFDRPKVLGCIRRFRQHPARVYLVALGAVAAATLVRLGFHQELSTTAPFTTYSLAVIFMALAGGFWPGMVTVALSVLIGSILFLPPAFSFTLAQGAEWTLFMFALFGSINVLLISGLIAGILLHDDHQQFLLRELDHRSQNLFAVIQGIVSRTLRESETLSGAQKTIETRLAALARTHAILADSGWAGAPLHQILSEELISFANQVSTAGCNVVLNTPAAQNFALIVHELATNAVKYGALSCPQGQIAIEGKFDIDDRKELFCFTWTESGGPAVKSPKRKGFGSSILNGLAKRFAQDVAANYRPEGLVYELRIPLSRIRGSNRDVTSKAAKLHRFEQASVTG